MSSIDNRVVQMQFDNKTFEEKVAETMKSLDKLKQSLDFASSKKGMDELTAAGKNFNVGGIGEAIEGVSTKFMAMATIGITALANITNRAVNAGIQLVKSLSLDPILGGFQEYETNMTSIQTILSNTYSKGTNLADVNKALDELNTYSDQTIYNFGEMARNIGTFTAAGVELGPATKSIKGIANLAAMSGSNSQQAATAMYQLSQAIASGSVKLMDWNSVVNAGMGGEIFQKALFESGKAMKTLTNVPMGMTFDEWKAKGNSFRESLQDGWITSEVLTKTLASFTGDLSEAQIMEMGYTKQQAAEFLKLGQTGKAAATEIKTFSQLMSTVKESIGSGWSQTFRILIGDFEEAKSLFTNIGNAIGGFVGKSADARNALAQGWKDLGGRNLLLEGFTNAIKGIGSVLAPIRDAFRAVFPPTTAQELFNLTKSFANFTKSLTIGGETAKNIKSIFSWLFSAIKIGMEIFKGIVFVIGGLIQELSGVGGGVLDFAAKWGDLITSLRQTLVEGGAIANFFSHLGQWIRDPSEFIRVLKYNLEQLFSGGIPGSDAVEGIAERLRQRFEGLATVVDAFKGAWERFSGILDGIKTVLGKVLDVIRDWFADLGQDIAAQMKPGDFDAALDIVNIGLLGGILLILRKFLQGGLKIDIGGGLIEKVKGALDGLTGTLKAMQTDLQAKTLMKIAGAVGILTISIVALSLIDSEALTKALVAISVGIGQLVAAMVLIQKLNTGTGAVKLVGITTGLMLLASAMVILSVAVKNLSGLDWEELAKGLLGVTTMLGALTVSTNLIAKDTGGMIRAGIAMTAISVALLVLSLAVKSFAEMSWEELGKGLVSVAIALGIITNAMNFMPVGPTLAAGLAMIPLATGLTILAGAVKLFSMMSWAEMAQGMIGIGAGLAIIAATMSLMPITLPITAAGLVILSVALGMMAGVLAIMGNMDIDTMAKALGSLAAMLLILSVAMNAMNGTLIGATSLLVVSGALMVLAGVLKILGDMSIQQLVTGLLAIAAVMAILGLSAALLSPVIPTLMALGVALGLVGIAFALFGVGAMMVAKAFEIISKAGGVAVDVLIDVITKLLKALPQFISAFVTSLFEASGELMAAGALLVKMVGILLIQILDTIIQIAPKLFETVGVLLTGLLTLIRDKGPEFIQTGFEFLLAFLKGVRDNISEITQVAIDIVINFAGTLIANAGRLVEAGVNLLLAFLQAIADRAADIATAGLNVLVSFLGGIANNIGKVGEKVFDIITEFITAVGNGADRIITAGANLIIDFVTGLGRNTEKVISAGVDAVISFITGLGQNALKLATAALDLIIDFNNGLADAIDKKSSALRESGLRVVGSIIDGITGGLTSRAVEVVNAVVGIVKGAAGAAINAIKGGSPSRVFMDIGESMTEGLIIGLGNGVDAENHVVRMAEKVITAFQDTLNRIPDSLGNMKEFNPVITPVLDLTRVQMASRNLNNMLAIPALVPTVSYEQARMISKTAEIADTEAKVPEYSGPAEVTFEQNIYSPTALSTNDIYRNTKSQIALAKEELKIS